MFGLQDVLTTLLDKTAFHGTVNPRILRLQRHPPADARSARRCRKRPEPPFPNWETTELRPCKLQEEAFAFRFLLPRFGNLSKPGEQFYSQWPFGQLGFICFCYAHPEDRAWQARRNNLHKPGIRTPKKYRARFPKWETSVSHCIEDPKSGGGIDLPNRGDAGSPVQMFPITQVRHYSAWPQQAAHSVSPYSICRTEVTHLVKSDFLSPMRMQGQNDTSACIVPELRQTLDRGFNLGKH